MASKMFQADADQLMVIAQMFTEQAEVAEEILNDLARLMNSLVWIGASRDAFDAEMEGEIFQGLKKLAAYMEQSSETAKQTAAKIEEGISYIFSKTKTYGA